MYKNCFKYRFIISLLIDKKQTFLRNQFSNEADFFKFIVQLMFCHWGVSSLAHRFLHDDNSASTYEPRSEKTGFRGFQPGQT